MCFGFVLLYRSFFIAYFDSVAVGISMILYLYKDLQPAESISYGSQSEQGMGNGGWEHETRVIIA